MSKQRVVVFVDYQNAYRRARDAFGATTSYTDGQFRPVALGLVLRGADDSDRELKEVRMYRGLPSSKWDPKGYEATQRQVAEWKKTGPVVTLHPALEVVGELIGPGHCEFAGWSDPNRDPRIPNSGGQPVFFHRLRWAQYQHVHDPTDYTRRAPRKPRPPRRH